MAKRRPKTNTRPDKKRTSGRLVAIRIRLLGGFSISVGSQTIEEGAWRLRKAASWIGATLLGFVIAGSIIFGVMNGSEPDTSLITKLGHGLVLGAALGVAQWFVLRRRLDKAKAWIAISTASWVVAELVGVALTGAVGAPFNLVGLFLVGGVLPGGGMMWLLRRALRKA